MAKKLTTKIVEDLFDHMAKKHKVKYLTEGNNLITRMLGAMGCKDIDAFLENYAVTIPNLGGNRNFIYTPPGLSLTGEVMLCAHEYEHIRQIERDKTRGWRWLAKYAVNPTQRAYYESSAYRGNVEMYFWLTGKMLDLDKLVKSLRAYGLNTKQRATVRKKLGLSARVVKRGGIINKASQDVVAFLEDRV